MDVSVEKWMLLGCLQSLTCYRYIWPNLVSYIITNHHTRVLISIHSFVSLQWKFCSSNKDIFRMEETCWWQPWQSSCNQCPHHSIANNNNPISFGIQDHTQPTFGGRSKSAQTHDPLVELEEMQSNRMKELYSSDDVKVIVNNALSRPLVQGPCK